MTLLKPFKICSIVVYSLFSLSVNAHGEKSEPQQPLSVSELRAAALGSDLAYELVKSLTVEVGPRMAGSEGDKRAVAWAQEKLKSLGFDRVYKEPVEVSVWQRGAASAEVLRPFPQPLVISALGGSIATAVQGLQADLVMFDSLQSLKQATKEEVEGKIVFINQRMRRDIAGAGYGPVVAGRATGAIEAAKLGAAAILIRSVGTDSTRFAHTGMMRYDDTIPKIPAAALSNSDADNLQAMLERTDQVSLNLNIQADEQGKVLSYNVIGEYIGSEKPEEIVLISAHLDSWDEGTGAIDDGAGVGIVSAAAHLVKTLTGQPKRTIRVVLYAAEEIGLVGGKAYAEAHKNELAKIIVAAESDFGAGPIYRLDTRFAESALQDASALHLALAPLGIAKGDNKAGGGPDISMLPQHGVPVVSLRQDGTYYFDYHHTPNDTFDKIVPEELAQNQAAWALFTYIMANSAIDPRPAPELSK